ncbi:hypothetical protein ACFSRY_15060 [Pontibacter locisalis]|uniref:STAS/SEC14 domain-containing protein n=1 Tax=Pontibacter locisalis TaxID=1719035 RepID=A0ABW5INN2_9BACT
MFKETLVAEKHITIQYDSSAGILYANWTGDQTKATVMDGCEKMLHFLKQHKCTKVLNDNTHVTSVWLEASWWVAVDWFPRMHEANCKLFAWVESPNPLSKLSIEETLKFEVTGVNALTFPNRKLAEEWLKEYDTE